MSKLSSVAPKGSSAPPHLENVILRVFLIVVATSSLLGCFQAQPGPAGNGARVPEALESRKPQPLNRTACTEQQDPLWFGMLSPGGTQAAVIFSRVVKIVAIGGAISSMRGAHLGLTNDATVSCYSLAANVLSASVAHGVLFAQTADLLLVAYDLKSLQPIAHTARIVTRARAYAVREDSVLIGGSDGIIYRWWWRGPTRLAFDGREKQLERYIGHSAAIESLTWHPAGETFFSGDATGVVNAWQVFEADIFEGTRDVSKSAGDIFTAKALRRTLPRLSATAPVGQLLVNSDGTVLALVTIDGVVELWRIAGLDLLTSTKIERFGTVKSALLTPSNVQENEPSIELLDRAGRRVRFSIRKSLDRWGIGESFKLELMHEADSESAFITNVGRFGEVLSVDRGGRVLVER